MLTRGGLDRPLRGSAERGCVRLCPGLRGPRPVHPLARLSGSAPRSEPGITALRPLRGSHPLTSPDRQPATDPSPTPPRHPPIDLSSTHPRIRHPPTEAPEEAGHGNPGSERQPREAGRDSVHADEVAAETGDSEGRDMVTPVRSDSQGRRGRDSVHADGSPTRQPTTDHAPTVRSPLTEAPEGRGHGNPGSEREPREAGARQRPCRREPHASADHRPHIHRQEPADRSPGGAGIW